MGNILLEVEMIPATNFYNNVRSSVTEGSWDKLRKQCYELANNKCEICGGSGKTQGFRHNVEAHEVWDYDMVKKRQKLVRLIALCPKCHMCKHIGRAFAIGKQDVVFEHISNVNNWTHKEVVMYMAKVFQDHRIRSLDNWTIDLSFLEKYGDGKKVKPSKSPKHIKKTWGYKQAKKKAKSKITPSSKKSPPKKK